MAYATINVTINGVTKAAIDVTGDGTEVILEESLTAFDKTVMDAVAAETGATFADKLAAHTMKNGMTADVVYASFIKVTADHDASVSAVAATQDLAGTLSSHAATLADHETRITALEP